MKEEVMSALMRSSFESKASTNRPRGERNTHVTATGWTQKDKWGEHSVMGTKTLQNFGSAILTADPSRSADVGVIWEELFQKLPKNSLTG